MLDGFVQVPNNGGQASGVRPFGYQSQIVINFAIYDIRHNRPVGMSQAWLDPSIELRPIPSILGVTQAESTIIPHHRLTMSKTPVAIFWSGEADAKAFAGHL